MTARILVNLLDGRRIKGADIWLVPQYNRDGVVRRTRQNAHGVDLNRNYPRHWKRQGAPTTRDHDRHRSRRPRP